MDTKNNTGNCNTGNCNTGDWNTGHCNTGDCNTGNSNTGDWNTGHSNTGDWNTGHSNTGDCNTGHSNTGNCNTGNCNTGDWNTGHSNTGDCNTGDWNTGHWNTGHCNTGHSNTGDWNTGHWNTGYFCVNEGPVVFFDLPSTLTRDQAQEAIPYVNLPVGCEWVELSKMTQEEKTANPNSKTIGGFLRVLKKSIQEAFPIAWAKLNLATKRRFTSLPNFDADKFLKCTGVDVLLDRDLNPKAIEVVKPVEEEKIMVIDGVSYKLVRI